MSLAEHTNVLKGAVLRSTPHPYNKKFSRREPDGRFCLSTLRDAFEWFPAIESERGREGVF